MVQTESYLESYGSLFAVAICYHWGGGESTHARTDVSKYF